MKKDFEFKSRLKIISKMNPNFWTNENLTIANNILLNIRDLADKAVESPDTDIPALAFCKKYIMNYMTIALGILSSKPKSLSEMLPLYEKPYETLKNLKDDEDKEEKESLKEKKEMLENLTNELEKFPSIFEQVYLKPGKNQTDEKTHFSNNANTADQNTVATGNDPTGDPTTINPPMSYGWVCPKCGRVNAPWKSTCDCSKGIAVPNTPPNTPYTPFYNPPIEIPNPFDPYGPYKWGDAPGWWDKGPTCKDGQKFIWGIEYPDGHIEKAVVPIIQSDPIPCSPSAGDPNFGKPESLSTNISSQSGGDPNIKAYN